MLILNDEVNIVNTFSVMIIFILLLLLTNLQLKLLSTQVDWRQCSNSLALCYFTVVMELPDSLWMNCKSEFDVTFLWCLPR